VSLGGVLQDLRVGVPHLSLASSREAKRLTQSAPVKQGASWSPDGQYLIYDVFIPDRNYDLETLKFEPGGEVGASTAFLATRFTEASPQVSPDGRYVANRWDESSSHEIYVREFPSGGGVGKSPNEAATNRAGATMDRSYFLSKEKHS
jgi:Tol biopolymer transport system component